MATPTLRRLSWTVLAGALALPLPPIAAAFGPLGHRIAGELAEPVLCPAARAKVAELGDHRSLGELGTDADLIRDTEEGRQSAPWHYMNVDDPRVVVGTDSRTAALEAVLAFRHPPEGDVLLGIERFGGEVANRALPRARRSAALRFVVHFVVDVHQPLHVGRVSDRGGNDILVRYGGEVVNLHHFWDTDVLALRSEGPEVYAGRLRPAFAATLAAPLSRDPTVWAAESLELRAVVYDFEPAAPGEPAVLDARYLAAAQRVAEQRIVLAAARLAATLNGMFCGSAAR
jgi:nuclease S1